MTSHTPMIGIANRNAIAPGDPAPVATMSPASTPTRYSRPPQTPGPVL